MRYLYWLLFFPLSFFDAENVHEFFLRALHKLSLRARNPGSKNFVRSLLGVRREPVRAQISPLAGEPPIDESRHQTEASARTRNPKTSASNRGNSQDSPPKFKASFSPVPRSGAQKTNVTTLSGTRDGSALNKSVMGLEFKNPVGLAAGLDKNAVALEAFELIGFGFVEVGTVTPRPQSGNPRPRLFRDYHSKAIFNAMGFNNEGCEVMKKNIDASRPYLDPALILGVNVGKNKDTPLEMAARDYAHCVRELYNQADYFTLNVSSPNTPGLRGLQGFSDLSKILEAVLNVIEREARSKPLVVKLAPEIPEETLESLITDVEANYPVAGWILTNTLSRNAPSPRASTPTGGMSGLPLLQASRQSLLTARKVSKKALISSGGILNADEALYRLALGADLVQLYSGLIFDGPFIVNDIHEKLLANPFPEN